MTVPAAVVATVRSLPRGTVSADDLELQNDGLDDASGGFHTIEEVIGRETTRAVAAGRSLSQDSLRAPLLVRRGEVVTVYVQGSGIRIRTNARAREDGSQGDLVSVDSLLNRKTYFTHVTGVREVEVYRSVAPGRASGGSRGDRETIEEWSVDSGQWEVGSGRWRVERLPSIL